MNGLQKQQNRSTHQRHQCQSYSRRCGYKADRELPRETEGHMLEVSTEALAAKARGTPVKLPPAERQRHTGWCIIRIAIGVRSV